jgi:elongator complex protein 4
MSFRRFASENQPVGTRISVHNGQTLTSSGVASLDELMGGGIPLGRILLLKQDNFSGYSNLLLKYFIAQGIALKHEISLVSLDNSPMELLSELMRVVEPSISDNDEEYVPPIQRGVGRTLGSLRPNSSEKMTIAWRYEKQGQFSQMSAKNNPSSLNINQTIAIHSI